jgi:hypothetical protein
MLYALDPIINEGGERRYAGGDCEGTGRRLGRSEPGEQGARSQALHSIFARAGLKVVAPRRPTTRRA